MLQGSLDELGEWDFFDDRGPTCYHCDRLSHLEECEWCFEYVCDDCWVDQLHDIGDCNVD